MRFAVVTPDPANWIHARAFDEVAEVMRAGLLESGHACERSQGRLLGDCVNIVFGAHLLPPSVPLPASSILFNLEQIVPGAMWVTPRYLELLRAHRVWDYSLQNIAALREAGVGDIALVPIGYAPGLERIVPQSEDIDVLFYGAYCERRTALVQRLVDRGWRAHYAFGAYGGERDELIARSKVVLNVHFYEQARLEVARCFYLLANGRFVLSEESPDAEETGLAGGIAFAHYEGLEEACKRYLENPAERAAISAKGRNLVRERPQAALLAPALARLNQL
jgi:Glycosyl transferases group 1